MSAGLVICAVCGREVHQWGPKDASGRSTWIHCNDESPICAGAGFKYPKSKADIQGPYCGADDIGGAR